MSNAGHNGGPPLTRSAGWIAIARSIRHHPLVGFHLFAKPCDANRGATQPALAFIDLIMECRYEDGAVMNGGNKMVVKRGELVGAISYLANRWNWTPKAVRGWLDRLEADGMIARFQRSADGVETEPKKGNQNGNQASVLRLCNYDAYQSRFDDDWQSKGQSRGNQGAIEGQSKGNNNKDNKGTKEQENNIQPTPEPRPETLQPSAVGSGRIGIGSIDKIDLGALSEKLVAACNGALDNPVNCLGLASLATPLMWMREGCDLEDDILPTLHGYGKSAHGKRIRTWDYFTAGVTKAKDNRLKGLPPLTEPQGKSRASSRHVPRPEGKSFADMNREILAEMGSSRK